MTVVPCNVMKMVLAAVMLAGSFALFVGSAGAATDQEPTDHNIICNDGTESPTCEVCRRGCCSHHGGCK
jgi:hypothetical protein